MTPADVIVAATSRAAEFLGTMDRGSLVPGKRADFPVLDAPRSATRVCSKHE